MRTPTRCVYRPSLHLLMSWRCPRRRITSMYLTPCFGSVTSCLTLQALAWHRSAPAARSATRWQRSHDWAAQHSSRAAQAG